MEEEDDEDEDDEDEEKEKGPCGCFHFDMNGQPLVFSYTFHLKTAEENWRQCYPTTTTGPIYWPKEN